MTHYKETIDVLIFMIGSAVLGFLVGLLLGEGMYMTYQWTLELLHYLKLRG